MSEIADADLPIPGDEEHCRKERAMASADPVDRAMVARLAAAERWGRTADRTAATAPAREGLRATFAREADPDGTLDQQQLDERVDSLMRAHMLRGMWCGGLRSGQASGTVQPLRQPASSEPLVAQCEAVL